MRVLVLFTTSEVGGAETSLSKLLLIRSTEVSVEVASLSGPNKPLSKLVASNFSSCKLVSFGINNAPFGRISLYSIIRAVRFIISKRIDVVYIVGYRASLVLRPILFLLRKKSIFALRWNPSSMSYLDRTFRYIEPIYSFITSLYISNSLAALETLFKAIPSLSSSKALVISNGINIVDITDRPSPSSKLVNPSICIVANLAQRKGHREFLLNMSKLVDKHPHLHLHLAGRDDLDGSIQNSIYSLGLGSHVTYHGYLDHVDAIYEISSINLLPSLYGEGCPTSILEASSQFIPTVAYDVDGISELVVHRETGLLASPGDISQLITFLDFLICNPDICKKMGDSAYSRVRDCFSVQNFLSSHLAAFYSLT